MLFSLSIFFRFFLFYFFLSTLFLQASITLKSGWNLVGVNSDLTLASLIEQIGIDNLEVIQGSKKTYQPEFDN